jgi:type II secretory pathway pseudopilin PulG
MKKFLKQKNKAFTLVETLVAISIFTISILGLISVLASGISDTGYAKKKISATYLAQEGIEYTRNIRDTHVLYGGSTGWNDFKIDPNITNYPISDPDFAGFNRTILMTPVAGTTEEVQITSDVSWSQGSGTYHIIFSENLFNWVE